MANESNNSNNKFYVHKVRKMCGRSTVSVCLVDVIDKEHKLLSLVGSSEVINLNQLYWGHPCEDFLLNFGNNIMMNIYDLSGIKYWIVDECHYGEYCHDNSNGLFSFDSMIYLDFRVKNNKLYAKSCDGDKFQSIQLSDIVFCPATKFDPSACFPYPVENKKELELKQPLANEINSIPIKNCWKNMFESMTTFYVEMIGADETRTTISFNEQFITVKEKPNTAVINNIIASIKSNASEIVGMTTHGRYLHIMFK